MYFLLLHNIQRIQYISLSGYRGHTIPATSPPLLLKVKLGHIGFPETLSNIQQVFSNALCVRLNRKWELGIFTKMSTSPLIFLKIDYFRHNYLEIVLCSVSLLMHIWVQVEHSLLCRQIYT